MCTLISYPLQETLLPDISFRRYQKDIERKENEQNNSRYYVAVYHNNLHWDRLGIDEKLNLYDFCLAERVGGYGRQRWLKGRVSKGRVCRKQAGEKMVELNAGTITFTGN